MSNSIVAFNDPDLPTGSFYLVLVDSLSGLIYRTDLHAFETPDPTRWSLGNYATVFSAPAGIPIYTALFPTVNVPAADYFYLPLIQNAPGTYSASDRLQGPAAVTWDGTNLIPTASLWQKLQFLNGAPLLAENYTAPLNSTITALDARLPAHPAAQSDIPVPPIPPTASAIRAEIDANSTRLAAIVAFADAINRIPSIPASKGDEMAVTSTTKTALANALLDLIDGVEPGLSIRTLLKELFAAVLGECENAGVPGGTMTFWNRAHTVRRLQVRGDQSGNRLSITRDDS